ncbi:Fe-S cluster biogenesis protein NfuA [Kitasatospora sp. MAP12-15]|uniref:NifU family protein n=1 Tax=unclassified Kitasatospora TaxID=2633591 RepID=UPI002474FE3B|nr:NifU family protein [Kitasatospora sp. MAP12-44]MDH6114399.1 Fe-S cluster biogenesis protein NfuA [Kitasatospora sp. MAP12-44]
MSAATAAPDAALTGHRVEEVLERLAATGDREVCASAEELVRVLMDFYGAGLARIVELLGRGGQQPGALDRLLRDELVSSLLVLHELHPEDVDTRIRRALAGLRNKPVELVDFDAQSGTLRVRASGGGGGCGCPSTGGDLLETVQEAMACFAPEVVAVELEAAVKEPALLQIGTRPSAAGVGADPVKTS